MASSTPNVTIEGGTFGDIRFHLLASGLGLPVVADAAGRHAWLTQWLKGKLTDIAPRAVVEMHLGSGGADALVHTGLAAELEDGRIHVTSATAEVERWREYLASSKRGGETRAAQLRERADNGTSPGLPGAKAEATPRPRATKPEAKPGQGAANLSGSGSVSGDRTQKEPTLTRPSGGNHSLVVEALRSRREPWPRDAAALERALHEQLATRGLDVRSQVHVEDRGDGRAGKVDLVASDASGPVFVEIDRLTPREKSVRKLLACHGAKVIVLRGTWSAPPPHGIDAVVGLGIEEPKHEGKVTELDRAAAAVVLAKLGERTKTPYRGGDAHTAMIIARYRSGFDEVDLRKVIGYAAFSAAEGGLGWQEDPKMRHYLRPETLFGPQTIERYIDAARGWFVQRGADEPEPSPEYVAWRAAESAPRLQVVR